MSLTFHCPSCGAPLDPPDSRAAAMRCPFCNTSVIIPDELKQSTHKESTLTREQVLTQLPDSSRTMIEIIRLIKAGQKEAAIIRFREAFDLSRTEAVTTVEAIENNQVVQLSHFQASHVIDPVESYVSQTITSMGQTPAKTNRGGPWLAIGFTFIVLAIVLCAAGFAMSQPGGPLYDLKESLLPSGRLMVLSSFGEEGLLPGQFSDAENLAVDTAGNIFVADFSSGRIQQFDPQGNFVRLWDASDEKLIIYGLEVDQNGILYVAAARNILRYDTKTGLVMDPLPNPENYFFYDIKILSDGSIGALVTDDDLVRMNPDGTNLWFVEDAISSIAGDSDTRGRLAVDGNNNIYISGTFVESIFKYSADGKYLNSWGSAGEEPGQFEYIYGVALTDKGQVAVLDAGQMELFEPDGRFVEQIVLDHTFYDVQFDATGKFYAVSKEGGVEILQFREE
jgi:DNA-binding beta-propeller fold protein YncE